MTSIAFVSCVFSVALIGFALGWMDGWRAGRRREQMDVSLHGQFHAHDGPSRVVWASSPDAAVDALLTGLTPLTSRIRVSSDGSTGDWR
jgi:hypothetical protein